MMCTLTHTMPEPVTRCALYQVLSFLTSGLTARHPTLLCPPFPADDDGDEDEDEDTASDGSEADSNDDDSNDDDD